MLAVRTLHNECYTQNIVIQMVKMIELFILQYKLVNINNDHNIVIKVKLIIMNTHSSPLTQSMVITFNIDNNTSISSIFYCLLLM